jgi:hypothetical protein
MTKITVDQILSLAKDAGCLVTEQKKFVKITSPNPNRKALYLGRTKTVLTRVDISGWEPAEHPAIRPLAKGVNGAVRGQILPSKDPNITDEMVQEAFSLALEGLMSEGSGFKAGV